MAWFRKPKYTTIPVTQRKSEIAEGLWVKCKDCGEMIYKKDWEDNLKVCPECNYHFRLSLQERITTVLDNDSLQEDDTDISPTDFLDFTDSKSYKERLKIAQDKTELNDAVITGTGTIDGHKIVLGILDFNFMGGSMGSVVGEKLTRAIEKAISAKLPLIIISSSGGARMQEGIMSLMQMAKTASAIARLDTSDTLFISVLTDPTTGGVTASFASLGDIIISETKALIGFAGPRVIEQTINQQLPKGFQRAEFMLEHGLIDMVVSRKELKNTLAQLLDLLD
ncbi:MAG: acetyl-CoA carboxylase, carboxyltransferase subunit beta [bacterium]|nr:acetyl-CoA carboxylase, carboxyltransferase subunit beta [bacterium]